MNRVPPRIVTSSGDTEGFAVVLRDDDPRLVRHSNTDSALAEAKRLAEAHPEHGFFVLAVEYLAGPVKPSTPVRRIRTPDDEIPF